MNRVHYIAPASIDDALEVLGEHGSQAALFAGGTDLLVRLRNGKTRVGVVLDTKQIEGMPHIEWTEQEIVLGASVTMNDVMEDQRIRATFPALATAASTVGSHQIRNRATIVGNVCNASPAADTVLPLLIYDAEVELVGPSGTRQMPLEEFIVGPGQTARAEAELVTAVRIPRTARSTAAHFERITRRRGVDLATVNLCCGVKDNGAVSFALGAAGPRPLVVSVDDGSLANPNTDERQKEKLLRELVATNARPITDVRGSKEYRSSMLVVLARRALRAALNAQLTEEGS